MVGVPERGSTCWLIDLQIDREAQSPKGGGIQGEKREKKGKGVGKRSRVGSSQRRGQAQTLQISLEEGNFPAGLSSVRE